MLVPKCDLLIMSGMICFISSNETEFIFFCEDEIIILWQSSFQRKFHFGQFFITITSFYSKQSDYNHSFALVLAVTFVVSF